MTNALEVETLESEYLDLRTRVISEASHRPSSVAPGASWQTAGVTELVTRMAEIEAQLGNERTRQLLSRIETP